MDLYYVVVAIGVTGILFTVILLVAMARRAAVGWKKKGDRVEAERFKKNRTEAFIGLTCSLSGSFGLSVLVSNSSTHPLQVAMGFLGGAILFGGGMLFFERVYWPWRLKRFREVDWPEHVKKLALAKN